MGMGAIFGKIKYAKRIFTENKRYLKPGSFRLMENTRVFFHDDTPAQRMDFLPRGSSSSFRKMVLNAVNRIGYFRVPVKKGANGTCTAIYIANNFDAKREVKLFDFSENQVIVVAKNLLDKEVKQIVFEALHTVYNMPQISDIDDDDANKYRESLIQKLPIKADFDPFTAICLAHKRQPSEIRNVSEAFKRCYEKPYDDHTANDASRDFLNCLEDKISEEVKAIRSIHAIQHGDLSRDNLLYGFADGKEAFFWIDWEHLNERPFYYDAFFYMVNSAVMNGDDAVTEKYNNGAFDACLSELFHAYGCEFFSEKRNEYLYLYMLDFVSERLCRTVAISALQKYRAYTEKYFG